MILKPRIDFLQITICFAIVVNTGLSSGQIVQRLDSLYGTLYKKGDLNGCVLIAENGNPIYEKAFGYANFNTKQLLDNQTMFELASVSKQFTAMAIMQLHQNHQLSYDDDISKYFLHIPYQGITISNLLHHTSGIPEFLGWNESQIDTARINYDKDILASIIKNKPALNFKPGEQLSYSNTNYVLLALIVEKVSGMSFSDYMNSRIFKPLKMTHTKIYAQRASAQKIKDYAFGYIYNPQKGGFVINDSIAGNRYQYYFDGIAGPYGISSNIEDMLKWDQALYTNKLVSKEEQGQAYITSKLNDGKPAELMGMPYGFGWLILPEKDYTGKRYMHTGGYPGYMTIIERYPDKNITIIILTNIWNVISMPQLSAATENILFGKPYEIPKANPFQKSVTSNPSQLKEIEGTYTLKAAPTVKIIITADATQAYAQVTGQIKVEIYPESELDYFYTVVNAKIEFVKEKSGEIKNLVLIQNGRRFEAVKD